MNWQEVCDFKTLHNLPFKIELNARGQIIMSPVKVSHAAYQGEIEHLLRLNLKNGRTFPECAISTRQGTKVADIVWVSLARFAQIKQETECSIAPEICVEVMSSSNSESEMRNKRKLYFAQGAEEVWICSQQGKIRFYNQQGKLKNSILAPEFPKTIKI